MSHNRTFIRQGSLCSWATCESRKRMAVRCLICNVMRWWRRECSRSTCMTIWPRAGVTIALAWPHVSRRCGQGDVLVVWQLDRLGRDLRHLVNTVHDLTTQGMGLKVLAGYGAALDTTTAAGKLVFGIFAALAEFERALIAERTRAGLAAARARGRKGGAPFKLTPPSFDWPWRRWAGVSL